MTVLSIKHKNESLLNLNSYYVQSGQNLLSRKNELKIDVIKRLIKIF